MEVFFLTKGAPEDVGKDTTNDEEGGICPPYQEKPRNNEVGLVGLV